MGSDFALEADQPGFEAGLVRPVVRMLVLEVPGELTGQRAVHLIVRQDGVPDRRVRLLLLVEVVVGQRDVSEVHPDRVVAHIGESPPQRL